MGGRSSRRKPAAPQWLNPMWQDDKKLSTNANSENAAKASNDDEVIINGVCVMNTDYNRDDDKTMHVEPQPADRTDDITNTRSDDEAETNEKLSKSPNQRIDDMDIESERPHKKLNNKTNEIVGCDKENDKTESNDNDNTPIVKKEIDDNERWDY